MTVEPPLEHLAENPTETPGDQTQAEQHFLRAVRALPGVVDIEADVSNGLDVGVVAIYIREGDRATARAIYLAEGEALNRFAGASFRALVLPAPDRDLDPTRLGQL